MKKLAIRLILPILAVVVLAVPCFAQKLLVPVGQAIGLELRGGGLTVAGFREQGGRAEKAGLKQGDTILKAQGVATPDVQALRDVLAGAEGSVTLTVRSVGGQKNVQVPLDAGGQLGIFVREGITGIGTVTYYDPDTGTFGTLGHGVSDPHGLLLPMEGGAAYPAEIISIRRGTAGTPGQLQGAFKSKEPIGVLERNTPCGVFGSGGDFVGIPLPLGDAASIHTGPAVILSDLTGGSPQEYRVEILQVGGGKDLLLKVTDAELLDAAGGIVQGMSGSPILQDGRLIGAVTHVLISDPTRGYGIFIEHMLAS